MESFDLYSHAIASVALFAAIALLLNPLVGIAREKEGLVPGEMPKADYASRAYRTARSYQNTVEMAGIFGVVVAAAIFAGAAPFWVNLFASLALVSRLIMVFVHIQNIGPAERGPRTMLFVFGWLMLLLIALLAVVAAI